MNEFELKRKDLEKILETRLEKSVKKWQEFALFMVDFCKKMEKLEKGNMRQKKIA